jgi:hypothetical protein
VVVCAIAIYRQPAKWKSIPSERMSQTTATISVAAAANAMPSFFFKFMALEPVACAMGMLRKQLKASWSSPEQPMLSIPLVR